jgi:hypothetical protein
VRKAKDTDEFEQLGVFDLTKRLNAGLYDEDKRKAARLWPG